MSASRYRILVWVVIVALAVVWTRPAAAEGHRQSASERALEARLELLEKQNETLQQQNRTIERQLSAQSDQIDALKHQVETDAHPTAELEQDVPRWQQRVVKVEKKQARLPIEVGFRIGWSESPYKMPGGFFYGAYLNHRLLDHEDGIPGGFVTGELLAGAVFGNHAVTSANLASILLPSLGPQSTWLDTVEIEPTVQYHADPALFGFERWSWAKPYLLAGPAIYVGVLSTPVVVKGDQAGVGFRHSDADVQAGGVVGFGTELALGRLNLRPIQGILDRTFAEAEWRYNEMANGEGFNQYTGSLAFGW